MSFTYHNCDNSQTLIDVVRLLISDTDMDPSKTIFSDQEILAMYQVNSSVFQSSMLFSPPNGSSLPSQPISYLRVAALLLDSLAANKSRLASIKNLPDVRLDATDAAIQLRETAKEYRTIEDESGAFVVIEQCGTTFGFRDRFFAQVQRQTGGGVAL